MYRHTAIRDGRRVSPSMEQGNKRAEGVSIREEQRRKNKHLDHSHDRIMTEK